MDELKSSVKQWYLLDKKIEDLSQELSNLRDKKKEIEQDVITNMKKNGMEHKKLNLGPVSIIYSTTMQLPPYNLELIEGVLDTIYKKGSNESIRFLQTLHANRENNRKPNNCIKKRKNRSTKKVARTPQPPIPTQSMVMSPPNPFTTQER